MTKTGSTKNKILNLLSTGNKTLSDISEELKLAPSTISQHLQELKDMGAIQEIESDHIRKWKYYELNPNFNYESSPIGAGIVASRITRRMFYYVIGLVGIVAVLAFVITSLYSGNSSGVIAQPQNGTYVPVTLTDPPIVPNGTQALVISYSSVELHVNGKPGVSGWIESNTSGSVDLMSLVNVSQVIAGIKVAQNFTVDLARFNITSATITINGTVYNVTVPNGEVTTRVADNGTINSTSGVLVDLSPTVVGITTNTTTVFVMVPYVKAVIIPNIGSNFNSAAGAIASATVGGNPTARIGVRSKLSTNEIAYLSKVHANLSITGGSIIASNDSADISVTVRNNGNQSVVIRNIVIEGNQIPVIIYNSTCGWSPTGKSTIYQCDKVVISTGVHANVHTNARVEAFQSLTTGTSVSGQVSDSVQTGQLIDSGSSVSASGGLNATATPIGPSGLINGAFDINNTQIHVSQGVGVLYNVPVHVYGNITASAGVRMPIDVKVKFPFSANANLTGGSNVILNGTALYNLITPSPVGSVSANGTFSSESGMFMIHAPPIAYRRAIDLLVEQNGTLTLGNQLYASPTVLGGSVHQNSGYTLQSGQTATFTFNGTLALPMFDIALASGSHYRIEALGSNGAYATSNITAT